jgi:hypothetical protein
MPEAMNAWMDWAPRTPDAVAASLVVRSPADLSVGPEVARYDPDDFFHHEQSIPPIHEE